MTSVKRWEREGNKKKGEREGHSLSVSLLVVMDFVGERKGDYETRFHGGLPCMQPAFAGDPRLRPRHGYKSALSKTIGFT